MLRRRTHMGRLGFSALCAAVVYLAAATAAVTTPAQAAAEVRRRSELAVALLRRSLGAEEPMPLPLALTVGRSPLLMAARAAEPAEPEAPAESEAGGKQETVPDPPEAAPTPAEPDVSAEPAEPVADNGVPARTLTPRSPEGYVVQGAVYVDNKSDKGLSQADLEGGFAARLSEGEGPKVLIVHTHGSEAYTMPPGQEYIPSAECRTTDCENNVVRVGAEIAAALEAAGIGTVQDTTLHDYPRYSGAYDRSLESIEDYLRRYPTITFVLDVHRDAVTDSGGNMYKVISETSSGPAAQMSFVVGTDGGGLPHGAWKDNLRLAAAVQQRLLQQHPTLMRPITVRNSRYNQHAAPGSLLVEMGAAGNSLQEALLSARLFGEALAEVILNA